MKPKTIEEYAEIYRCPATNENEYCRHDIISAINFGIELQKKISYNEDELIKFISFVGKNYIKAKGFYYIKFEKSTKVSIHQILEQFKKQ